MKTEKRITLKSLCENTNIPESLVRAVVRQLGGWESFTQSTPDISNYGIDRGFHGFIYTKETEDFAKRHRKDITAMARNQASEFGIGSIEMIRGFGCFRNDPPTDEEIGSALYAGKNLEGGTPVLYALAWYAGEEVARAYVDMIENA